MSARMHLSSAHHAHPRTPGEEQFALAAELLALLGDRTRLTLLHALTVGEADVGTLTEVCGAARPAVSQHLARLRLAGLVGTLAVTAQGSEHHLDTGDCLRLRVWGPTRFRCVGPGETRYVLAVVRP
ncbi:ArsR family transcriptional regulator [Streptomyces sp. NPDC005921]